MTDLADETKEDSCGGSALNAGLGDDYKRTQPYQLGLIYKQLGEMLMNPKTDIEQLVKFSRSLGVNFSVTLGNDDNL